MKKMLALVMLLCLLVPACALADVTIKDGDGNPPTMENNNYYLEAGGEYTMEGTSDTCVNMMLPDSGHVYLTLNDVSITGGYLDNALLFDNQQTNATLHLKLMGVNTLESTNYITLSSTGSMVIEGDGSLIVKMNGSNGRGIYCGGSMTVQDSASVTLKGSEYGVGAVAVVCGGNLTVKNNASLSANYGWTGIEVSNGNVTVEDNASLTAETAGLTSISAKNVTVRGGTVTASATGVSGYGIYASENVTVSGGTVTASATGVNGYGIFASENVTVSGGTVTASATGRFGYGIYASKNVTVSGGMVTAEGGMCSMRVGSGIDVSGYTGTLSVMARQSDSDPWTPIQTAEVEKHRIARFAPGVEVGFEAKDETKTLVVEKNEDWKLPTLQQLGFSVTEDEKFGGWKRGETIYQPGNTVTTTSDEDTFHAEIVVTYVRYTITYKTHDGDTGIQIVERFPVEDDYVIVAEPYNSEWGMPESTRFSHWETEDTQTRANEGENIEIMGDTVFVPVFVPVVELTYLDMHGDAHTSSVDKDMSVRIDDYEDWGWDVPEGQVFSHWLAQETGDELQAGDIVMMTKDLVLEPVFAQAVTITWLDGDGNVYLEQRVPKGSVQPVFPMRDMQYSEKSDWSMLNTQEGEFIGWTVADNGFMLPLDRGFIADRDMTMLANYELKPMAHVYFYDQITMHGYGRDVPVGSKIKAPAVDTMRYEEEGKSRHFLHWVDEATGKEYKPYAPITVTGDMKFTTYHEVYEGEGNVTIRVKLSPDAGVTLVSYPAGYYFYAGWAADGMRIKGVRYDGKLYDAHGELSLWGRDGKEITLELVHEKLPEPTRIPWGAAADLPQTGDPSMLGAWALLLGAASAMGAGMKLRSKK